MRRRTLLARILAEQVGDAIARRRAQRRWSYADVARAVPCDRQQVYQWESGVLPTLPNLYAVAMALECSPFDLLPQMRDVIARPG